ncbi:pyridoxine/pyridoxamine 5'-phosphate oxidase [Streptomyces omiyaensis]|uniref:pyridoxine/pyridoxamine 5'-phosphate oxidase n=1 Tax=Streptomyces omiyaensis TaxID=68247 RepID=UPI001672BB71|nr:pyridoxal 5'-phosphate synthase [Streptomyces omiyaensis]GGY54567.1 pyridoxamine 5'-phosphate oxidase [Streptomyces omiyaensis]
MPQRDSSAVRAWLRGIEVFARPLPAFDPGSAPAEPAALFLEWLTEAVDAGVPDPHAMTLSTVDEAGDPDARVLILKNVDASGFQFAAHAAGPKGVQLAGAPRAALTFYRAEFGRQVRVRGAVTPDAPERSAADFLARGATARAESLLGRQSRYLTDPGAGDRALRESLARVEADPGLVDPDWTLYTVVPDVVEFWQAAADRVHVRLRYEREPAGWQRRRLWS